MSNKQRRPLIQLWLICVAFSSGWVNASEQAASAASAAAAKPCGESHCDLTNFSQETAILDDSDMEETLGEASSANPTAGRIQNRKFLVRDIDVKDLAGWAAKVIQGEKKGDGRLLLALEGVPLPMQVYIDRSENALRFVLPHPNKHFREDSDIVEWMASSCFVFSVTLPKAPEQQLEQGNLDWVTSAAPHCRFQGPRMGRSFMRLTDFMAASLGLSEVQLDDYSVITCEKDVRKKLSLGFLFLLKKGQTWYESLGYRAFPRKPLNGPQEIKTLREYSLKKVREVVQARGQEFSSYKKSPLLATPYFQGLHFFETKLKEYSQLAVANDRLADFLVWAWDHDCENFEYLKTFLFPTHLYGGEDYVWNKLAKNLTAYYTHMTKYY